MLDGTLPPNRKAKHNAKVRARILDAASQAFRKNGYDGTGIDALMGEADLTRGAFYAHFRSKEALFVEVVASDDPLLARLKERDDEDTLDLWRSMLSIFNEYLETDRVEEAVAQCHLVAFARDAAQGSPAARRAYESVFEAYVTEMTRGLQLDQDDMIVHSALTQVVGAVTLASAAGSAEARSARLSQGIQGFRYFARKMRRNGMAQGVAQDAETE